MLVPAYLPYVVFAGSVGTIVAILFGLNLALERASWAEGVRRRVVRGAAFGLVAWFALSVILAVLHFYQGTSDGVPTVQFGLVLPILVGALAIWRSDLISRLIEAVPQQWLVGVQLYRALGVVFLTLYAAGRLPGLFALPAGIGDVAVGLAAPFVASAYARDPQAHRSTVWTWNVLGLADLLVAVTAGFLTSPSQLQLFAFDNPNELITMFPLVLVPVYMVPLSIVLHLASLAKLKRTTVTSRAAARSNA